MKILQAIGGVILMTGAIFIFLYAEKEFKQEREDGEFHSQSIRTFGCGVILLLIGGFMFFSVFD